MMDNLAYLFVDCLGSSRIGKAGDFKTRTFRLETSRGMLSIIG